MFSTSAATAPSGRELFRQANQTSSPTDLLYSRRLPEVTLLAVQSRGHHCAEITCSLSLLEGELLCSAFHQVGLYRRTGAGCLVCIIWASLRNQELQCNSRELVMDKPILLCAFRELLLVSSKRHYNPGIKTMNLGGWREISEVNSIGGSCRQPGFKFPAPTQYLSAACNSVSGLRRDQAYLANRHTCKTKHSYNKIFKRYKKKKDYGCKASYLTALVSLAGDCWVEMKK